MERFGVANSTFGDTCRRIRLPAAVQSFPLPKQNSGGRSRHLAVAMANSWNDFNTPMELYAEAVRGGLGDTELCLPALETVTPLPCGSWSRPKIRILGVDVLFPQEDD